MKITLSGIIAIIIIVSCSGRKDISKNLRFENDVDSLSYYTGIFTAWTVKDLDLDCINTQAFNAGIREALNNDKPKVSKEDANFNIQWFFEKLQNRQAQKNLDEGRAYLEKNKNRKEVITTSSGLQYEIIKEGTSRKPNENDSLLVDFTGTLVDGTVFISTNTVGPETFSLKQKDEMKGWLEALQLMDIGSIYKFYIPAELGFGINHPSLKGLKPNAALIFEIHLLSVVSEKTKHKIPVAQVMP